MTDSEYLLTGNEEKDWETLMFLYSSALKQINTKIEILREEFQITPQLLMVFIIV